jgi:hypothetical protein
MAQDQKGMQRRVPGTYQSDRLYEKGQRANADRLRLVHVTSVGAIREILNNSAQIERRKCKVFKEDLVYFFVLRPAYKLKDAHEKWNIMDYFPCVLVLKPQNLGTPYHIYPFDTGAAHDGHFHQAEHTYTPLDDFALENDLGVAAHHIEQAFGSNESYYDGNLEQDLKSKIPYADFHALWPVFVNVARLAATGWNQPDKRSSAIEVAYNAHIQLKDNVELVILPRQFLENNGQKNTAMLDALKRANVPYETYNWTSNTTPQSYQAEISDMVKAYYNRHNLL